MTQLVKNTSATLPKSYRAEFEFPVLITGETLPVNFKSWMECLSTPVKAYNSLREVKTIEDALMVKTPSLAAIRKANGVEYADAYIKAWVIDLQNSLNLKHKLNETMLNMLSGMILDEFWGLTIADIKNVLYGAKMGLYGEFYESISIPKVIGWFREYFDQRFEVAESFTLSEHYHQKRVEGDFRERTKDLLTDAEKLILKK